MTIAASTQAGHITDQLNDPVFLADLRHQMIKFAVLQMSSIQSAEDVVQEALISALEHAASFSGRCAFKTWVFAILKNKIIDFIRKQSRLISMTDLFDDDAEKSIDTLFNDKNHWHAHEAPQAWPSPDQMLEQEDFWIVFDACLNHLPAQQAQVFMLREMIELSSQEICNKLGLTISNFNVLMYRSRTRLRECLENKWLLKEDCSC